MPKMRDHRSSFTSRGAVVRASVRRWIRGWAETEAERGPAAGIVAGMRFMSAGVLPEPPGLEASQVVQGVSRLAAIGALGWLGRRGPRPRGLAAHARARLDPRGTFRMSHLCLVSGRGIRQVTVRKVNLYVAVSDLDTSR